MSRNSDLAVFTQTNLDAKKTTLVYLAWRSPCGLYFRAYFNFARVVFPICICMFVALLFLLVRFVGGRYFRARPSLRIYFCTRMFVRAPLYLFLHSYVRARASVFIFVFLWVKFWVGVPARRVNPRDDTTIVQFRLVHKENKQTQTEKRSTSGPGPAKRCAQVGSAQHVPF